MIKNKVRRHMIVNKPFVGLRFRLNADTAVSDDTYEIIKEDDGKYYFRMNDKERAVFTCSVEEAEDVMKTGWWIVI